MDIVPYLADSSVKFIMKNDESPVWAGLGDILMFCGLIMSKLIYSVSCNLQNWEKSAI